MSASAALRSKPKCGLQRTQQPPVLDRRLSFDLVDELPLDSLATGPADVASRRVQLDSLTSSAFFDWSAPGPHGPLTEPLYRPITISGRPRHSESGQPARGGPASRGGRPRSAPAPVSRPSSTEIAMLDARPAPDALARPPLPDLAIDPPASPARPIAGEALFAAARSLLPTLEAGRPLDAATLRDTMTRAFGASDASGAWVWKDA